MQLISSKCRANEVSDDGHSLLIALGLGLEPLRRKPLEGPTGLPYGDHWFFPRLSLFGG